MRSFFLRHILHDWPDDQAAAILRTLRAAVPQNGARGSVTLLIQDAVMDERRPGTLHTTLDLQMLVICGSKERTLAEWEALLEASGWRLAKLWPLRTVTQLLEARPA